MRRFLVMREQIIQAIICRMLPSLNNEQTALLQCVLEKELDGKEIIIQAENEEQPEEDYVGLFITSKRIEGCLEKTLIYYESTIRKMHDFIKKRACNITTEDLRGYLSYYQTERKASKVTIDNIRRILSSYYAWLEDEDFILKSPVRRIHKIKTTKVVKDTYTDEELELMRDNCSSKRDLAIIDMLASTGIRVGELVPLDKDDVNFNEREYIVLGKGDKERIVYFDARTKIHLSEYLESRSDDCPALFVSLNNPVTRITINAVEVRLRELGKELGLSKVHPHKFRRTLATTAIDKGMPIEQVQTLLGHQKIDTTMQYAMVKQQNVKTSHRKYIG